MRVSPIHRSLTRPILVLGANRNPAMILALISTVLGIAGGIRLPNVILALCIFFGGIWVFRWMAQKDPFYFDMFLRHIRQQDYYPSISEADGKYRQVPERTID